MWNQEILNKIENYVELYDKVDRFENPYDSNSKIIDENESVKWNKEEKARRKEIHDRKRVDLEKQKTSLYVEIRNLMLEQMSKEFPKLNKKHFTKVLNLSANNLKEIYIYNNYHNSGSDWGALLKNLYSEAKDFLDIVVLLTTEDKE